jgi:replicative DNA helicase
MVLNAIIRDNNKLPSVQDILTGDDFFQPANQKIFETMNDMFSKGIPIDIVTLNDQLEKRKLYYANEIQDLIIDPERDFMTTHSCCFHAKIVRDKSRKRKVLRATEKFKQCLLNTDDITETISIHLSELTQVNVTCPSDLKPFTQTMGETISTLRQELANPLEVKKTNSVPSGFDKMDQKFGSFLRGGLYFIAGDPGEGKTAMALQIAIHAMEKHNLVVAIYSMEMCSSQLTKRILSIAAKVNIMDMKTDEDLKKIERLIPLFKNNRLSINDNTTITIHQIEASAKRYYTENNNQLDVILVDYISLISGSNNQKTNRNQEVGEYGRRLKLLATQLKCVVICVSQLNRNKERLYNPPALRELRESGELEGHADGVLMIWHKHSKNVDKNESPDSSGIREVWWRKNRWGYQGMIKLHFNATCTSFEDYEEKGMAANSKLKKDEGKWTPAQLEAMED